MFISIKGALVIGRTNRAESGEDETVLEQALGNSKICTLFSEDIYWLISLFLRSFGNGRYDGK